MSLPEVLIWQLLRARPHGLKFRRQHPAGAFVLDFYCADAQLAIEIDGSSHDHRIDADARRDAWFADTGITTVRLAAADILQDAEAACASIVALARSRLPLHHPAAPDGPPPRD